MSGAKCLTAGVCRRVGNSVCQKDSIGTVARLVGLLMKHALAIVTVLAMMIAPAVPGTLADPIDHDVQEAAWGTVDQARETLAEAGADTCNVSSPDYVVACPPYDFAWTSHEAENCRVAVANADTGRLRAYNPWDQRCFDAASVGVFYTVNEAGYYAFGHQFAAKRVELRRANSDAYNPSARIEIGLVNWYTGNGVYGQTVRTYAFASGDGDFKAWSTDSEGANAEWITGPYYLQPGTYLQYTYVIAGSPQNSSNLREWAVLDGNADWMRVWACQTYSTCPIA